MKPRRRIALDVLRDQWDPETQSHEFRCGQTSRLRMGRLLQGVYAWIDDEGVPRRGGHALEAFAEVVKRHGLSSSRGEQEGDPMHVLSLEERSGAFWLRVSGEDLEWFLAQCKNRITAHQRHWHPDERLWEIAATPHTEAVLGDILSGFPHTLRSLRSQMSLF